MAREVARRARGPRGAPPDFAGREPDRVQTFNTPVPQHTPGQHCGECRPKRCAVETCDGWAHRLGLDWGYQCGICGKRQI